MNDVQKLQKFISESNHIVFFGGAGVSTESGLKDFRSADGLYSQNELYPPEQILSHSFFLSHPSAFYRFYKEHILYQDKYPNACHYKLAEMERKGKLNAVITQNIDSFHSIAGNKRVIELHGSIMRNYCIKCHRKYEGFTFMLQNEGIPYCSCGGIIRPDVVLYEEALNEKDIARAIYELSRADLVIVGGTSLKVYPAANLLRFYHGKNLIIINREMTFLDKRATLHIQDKIAEVMAQIKL